MIANTDQRVVVVPWDFNRLCRAGLEHALKLTDDSNLIHVVHVAAPLSGPDNGVLYATAEKRKCEELEDRFRAQIADDSKLNSVKFHVFYGHFGTEIARFADQSQAELIVIPARNKRSVADFLFGGMAKQVVSQARRPVLVVQVDESTAGLPDRPNKISATLNRIWSRKQNVANVG